MNTVVLSADGAAADALQKSEGVWHAAWRRFQADRVGLVSLVVVLVFIALIVLSALGLVAAKW
ncbi:MAG TPA: ABC transporter permease, partial [Rubrivivax sp.]|nr:ABC transporter permease [Rubrivivax sp.]